MAETGVNWTFEAHAGSGPWLLVSLESPARRPALSRTGIVLGGSRVGLLRAILHGPVPAGPAAAAEALATVASRLPPGSRRIVCGDGELAALALRSLRILDADLVVAAAPVTAAAAAEGGSGDRAPDLAGLDGLPARCFVIADPLDGRARPLLRQLGSSGDASVLRLCSTGSAAGHFAATDAALQAMLLGDGSALRRMARAARLAAGQRAFHVAMGAARSHPAWASRIFSRSRSAVPVTSWPAFAYRLSRHDHMRRVAAFWAEEATRSATPEAWAVLAQIRLELGQVDRAATAITKALAAAPADPRNLWLEGRIAQAGRQVPQGEPAASEPAGLRLAG